MIRLHRIAIAAGLTVALLGSVNVALAQTASTFFVTDVDASAFPTVQFRLRAVDLENKPVSGLSATNIAVYENGEQVPDLEVIPHADGPIAFIFVIDEGRSANYRTFGEANMRQIVQSLVSGGYFKEGRDTVMVMARQYVNNDQTQLLLPATQSASDLTTWTANHPFAAGRGNTKGLLAVQDAINEMGELISVPGGSTAAIIFITRWIEDPSGAVAESQAQNIAAEARSNYISVYALHTDPNGTRGNALQLLATGSNGDYSVLRRTDFPSIVTSMYKAIDAQRTYYTVTYRSPTAEAGPRQITINTPQRPSEGVIGTYEVNPLSPSINITEPTPQSIILREAEYAADGTTLTYDTSQTRVVAEVEWPDGFPRQITSAQLLVNGNLEDSLTVGEGQTRLEFQWDISDVISAGSNAITLEVAIEDELGMTGSADRSVTVEVILPPTPTPEGPAVSPGVLAIGLPALCIIAALVVAGGGGAYYLFRRRSQAAVAAPVAQAEVARTILSSDAFPGSALATLTVLEGPSGLIGEPLKILKPITAIGRNPAQTDLAFYTDEESSVSRLHCTVQQIDDKTFELVDNNSSAGTRLNGRRIQGDSPVVLADGDEIVLGDLARRGVKLRFNLPSAEILGPHVGSADDRTHLIGDLDPSEWEGFPDDD